MPERLDAGVKAALADLLVDALAQGAQVRQEALSVRTTFTELFDEAHHTIDRHPGHDLGVSEVAATAAHLPDALVGVLPDLAQVLDEGPPRARHVFPAHHPHLAGLVNAGRHLAIDIELKLIGGRVADADRLGALIAGQPGELELGEPRA